MNEPENFAHAEGIETIDASAAAEIGLRFGASAYSLIYVTAPDGSRQTIVCEPNQVQMIQQASQAGSFEMTADQLQAPLVRAGWRQDWRPADDAAAWIIWNPITTPPEG